MSSREQDEQSVVVSDVRVRHLLIVDVDIFMKIFVLVLVVVSSSRHSRFLRTQSFCCPFTRRRGPKNN